MAKKTKKSGNTAKAKPSKARKPSFSITLADKKQPAKTITAPESKKTPKSGDSKKSLSASTVGAVSEAQAQFSEAELLKNLPPGTKEKLEEIKKKIEKLKDKVLAKFETYTMSVALLPPPKDEKLKNKISAMVLIDDSDSKKLNKLELKDKIIKIVDGYAKNIDKEMLVDVVLISEVWQSCFDGKYELIETISLSAPVYDNGIIAAIKISEIHKTMVLKKFEKYIVSYVLAGSLTQGRATPQSDVDVFIVIDDTDVKKMTRVELKDKLRAIIIGMGLDAGKMTGIENKLNIQVYILTDFWENIKEANPVIFTFLRDGVPFYDRGIFMAWKQLLKMGKIKPSPEAIDMFMSTGDQMLKRIKASIRAIGQEDTYYAILTPSQAALMLYGVPPPTPKETPNVLREIFVKKEKILEDEYVKILENNIKIRKDLEHGTKKELTGSELDKLISNADKFLERLKKLFEEIQAGKEKEHITLDYESTINTVKDVLRLQGFEDIAKDAELIECFQKNLIDKGHIDPEQIKNLQEIVKGVDDYKKKTLTKNEASRIHKRTRDFVNACIEFIQRKRIKELERTKMRVKYGSKFGEIILLGKDVFVIEDIDAHERQITRGKVDDEGHFKEMKKSTPEELEHALASQSIPPRIFVKETIFENMKMIFGKDVEIMLNY
ncbi:nucleotidyltransferase domain-containing protein [Candidatus Woesearchaeota archaeon]|nr:nucleotidyltransferase domain-containing protein [Candidatus Woesearchaeota archaeon]